MSYDLYDRVLGCLLAAGMGDGIGAPTEGLSQDEIAAEYGKATGLEALFGALYLLGRDERLQTLFEAGKEPKNAV